MRSTQAHPILKAKKKWPMNKLIEAEKKTKCECQLFRILRSHSVISEIYYFETSHNTLSHHSRTFGIVEIIKNYHPIFEKCFIRS